MKTVGIIGGSGFIGSHNTKIFLAHGFNVKYSVTDINRKEKYEHLKEFGYAENLQICELDVTGKNSSQDFVSGCAIIVHGGTPFQLDVKDPQSELLYPTIRGTENFLDVVQHTPGIEKVVSIASVAAYNTNLPLLPGGKSAGDTIDETDVFFISEQSHPDAQAKFTANQTVNTFIADNVNSGVEITSVSPVGVWENRYRAGKTPPQRVCNFSLKIKLPQIHFYKCFMTWMYYGHW